MISPSPRTISASIVIPPTRPCSPIQTARISHPSYHSLTPAHNPHNSPTPPSAAHTISIPTPPTNNTRRRINEWQRNEKAAQIPMERGRELHTPRRCGTSMQSERRRTSNYGRGIFNTVKTST
ncbi:hypothetical protein BDN71DRAFT_329553 [Pleurotus eryngii]|uniref:Uncharacterized protein n=1 Tax=Pleurotus eryngii TaxID=5323 RepID=A0A9P5ZN70_PLEER|nr:hypothetical protein BDN71DRAFT_329553 [Pleurotus eryngii]